jgi:hypothetical protein
VKIKFAPEPFDAMLLESLRKDAAIKMGISETEASYFIFTGEAVNTTYNPAEEHINILYRDGTVADISKVDNALIHQRLATPVKKYYLCYLK